MFGLFRRQKKSPLLKSRAYAELERAIAHARAKHQPVRHLQQRKAALVRQALEAGVR